MIDALAFLVDTLFSLLFWAFLLRCLLQWVRAGFRNPFGAAILQATDWLVLPLRRVLPSFGRIDSGSVVAVLAVALAQIGVLALLTGGGFPDAGTWLLEAGREVLRSALWLYFWAIFIYALLSMIAPGQDSPLLDILEALCEPVLSRIRRAVPSFAGLDLSPMWAAIIIQVLLILLR
jgi:YggT family protein